MKNKKKQVNNFIKYPIKTGFLKKTKDKFYITEENGALRGLVLRKNSYFFDANGQFVDADDVFFEDSSGDLQTITNAELFTSDGTEVYAQKIPELAPADNDSQNAFALSMLEKIQKLHIPSWYEKVQHFALIASGIIAGVLIVMITKYAG
jgi:hypothetical protein